MTITITHTGTPTGHWVVRLAGEVDVACTAQLRSLAEALALSEGDVDVDLSRVTFIDSSGWVEIRKATAAVQGGGRRVRIVNPSRAVRRLTDALAAMRAHLAPAS
jgi:anti-anti-sigma factor